MALDNISLKSMPMFSGEGGWFRYDIEELLWLWGQ